MHKVSHMSSIAKEIVIQNWKLFYEKYKLQNTYTPHWPPIQKMYFIIIK